MKLTPDHNAAVIIAVVGLLFGKYGEKLFEIPNLIPGMVVGMLFIVILVNYQYYIDFGKRVMHFLYVRWQWPQHQKMLRYQQQQFHHRP